MAKRLRTLLHRKTLRAIADACGVSPQTPRNWGRANRFPAHHTENLARVLQVPAADLVRFASCAKHGVGIRQFADQIEANYRSGYTLAQLGARHGVTRERIRQILAERDISGADGGQRVCTERRRAERAAKRDVRYLAKRGMRFAEYRAMIGRADRPLQAYRYQERTARYRNIGWEFNFGSWWKVWQDSGKWAERGRGRGYCMSRINDEGPYAPWNVRICTGVENVKEYYDRERATHGRVRNGQERYNPANEYMRQHRKAA